MSKYTIDYEAWTTIEAPDLETAYAIAQDIINETQRQLPIYLELERPLEMVVRDGGIREES